MSSIYTRTLLHGLIPALISVNASAQNTDAGKLAYEIHCKACHLPDAVAVGPSLIAIAGVYPGDQQQTFIDWAKAPGKKNPSMIQMPSMAHVPDDDLKRIHDYVLRSTAGKKEKKGNHQFKHFKHPKRKLPYVVRAFLPDASPASVATILPNETCVCWDTETCRLAYSWHGARTGINSYFGPTKLTNPPFYRETTPHLFEELSGEKPKFLGYRLIKGFPEFHYRLGNLEVKELITQGSSQRSLKRKFTIQGANSKLTLNLAHDGQANISSDKGSIKNDLLTLTTAEAATFTLTIAKK